MNDKDFDVIFPYIRYSEIDRYHKDCDFFFLNKNDLQNCHNYINKKKQIIYDENRFAFEKCRQSLNKEECCKNQSKNKRSKS